MSHTLVQTNVNAADFENVTSVGDVRIVERVYTVITFVFLSGAFIPMYTGQYPGEVDTAGSSQAVQVVNGAMFLLYAGAVYLHLRNAPRLPIVFVGPVLPWLLVVLAIGSATWSFAPYASLFQGLLLAGSTAFGVYVSTRFSTNEQLRLLAIALLIAAVASVLTIVLAPDSGVSSIGWRGVFGHKNTLGGMMAVSILAALTLIYQKWCPRVWAMSVGLSLLLLLRADSATAAVSCASAILVAVVITAMKNRPAVSVATVLIVIFVGGMVMLWLPDNLAVVVDALGRDVSLTGRTDIWAAAVHMVQERPFLGYGYSAFWRGPGSPSEYVWQELDGRWFPSSAHNGYLEIALALGSVGLGVFLVGAMIGLIKVWKSALTSSNSASTFAFALLVYVLVTSFADFAILTANSLIWVLLVMILSNVAKVRNA